MKYIFIVNKSAGKGETLNELQEQLDKLNKKIDYEIYFTKSAKDATSYVNTYSNNNPKEDVCFVACGGDGTINEVACGLVGKSNKHLGILAFGSGNDFVKYYKDKNFKSVQALVDGTAENIDIMKVNDSYAINICNFGFDAVVGSTANKVKEKGGKNPYGAGVRKAIFTARYNKIKVVVDGEKISRNRMLLCTLANGSFVGGQYNCAPRSKNNDGLIDVCLVHCMSLIRFLLLLGPYTRGEHLDRPDFKNRLTYKQGKHIEVSSEKEIELCLDGEMLPGKFFQIDIMPKAISLVVPKG